MSAKFKNYIILRIQIAIHTLEITVRADLVCISKESVNDSQHVGKFVKPLNDRQLRVTAYHMAVLLCSDLMSLHRFHLCTQSIIFCYRV